MPGTTNRWKLRGLQWVLQRLSVTPPTNFYLALCTNAITPTADIDTFGQLTQIAVGNGYADGGAQLSPNNTDFDVATEDDTGDTGTVQVKDIVFNASGGPIPASGSGAYYWVLTDNNATVANREVLAFGTLLDGASNPGPFSVSDGQPMTVQDATIQATEA